MRPKPAYYTIARELKPITVGVFRTVGESVPRCEDELISKVIVGPKEQRL